MPEIPINYCIGRANQYNITLTSIFVYKSLATAADNMLYLYCSVSILLVNYESR